MGNAQKKLGLTGDKKPAANSSNKKMKTDSNVINEKTLEAIMRKGLITDFYDVQYDKVLGRGHYAVVNLGIDKKTGMQVAVKRIQIAKSRIEALQREVQVLRRIGKHPNIVTLYDIFITDTELQLVLELLQGGELFDRMVEKGPYSELEASHHVRKIGLALKYLHQHGIVHRDLKPENLILANKRDDSELKIADFGLSKIVDNVQNATLRTVCGTWAYCAPEVKTTMQGGQAAYSAAVDLWSVGVILYVILGAYHPFDPDGDATDDQLWDNICKGEFDFNDPAWETISSEAKDLIKKLIVIDTKERYTTDQLLKHPWVNKTASVPATPITPSIDQSLINYVRNKNKSKFNINVPNNTYQTTQQQQQQQHAGQEPVPVNKPATTTAPPAEVKATQPLPSPNAQMDIDAKGQEEGDDEVAPPPLPTLTLNTLVDKNTNEGDVYMDVTS